MTNTPNFEWDRMFNKDDEAVTRFHSDRDILNGAVRDKFHEFGNTRLGHLIDQRSRKSSGKGSVPEGLDKLYQILVEMKRDIKKVAKGNCIDDATAYADKLTKQRGIPHKATQADINQDGIPEIVIHDVYGNPVVINGYTTVASKWPERMQYYSTRELSQDKKRVSKTTGKRLPESLQEWRQRVFSPEYGIGDDILKLEGFNMPHWATESIKAGYTTIPHEPKNRRRPANRALNDEFLKHTWNYIINEDATIPKGNYLACCGFVWNYVMLSSAFLTIYEDQGLEFHINVMKLGAKNQSNKVDFITYDKAKKGSEMKQHLEGLVIKMARKSKGNEAAYQAIQMFLSRIMKLGNQYIVEGKNPEVFDESQIREALNEFDRLIHIPQRQGVEYDVRGAEIIPID